MLHNVLLIAPPLSFVSPVLSPVKCIISVMDLEVDLPGTPKVDMLSQSVVFETLS